MVFTMALCLILWLSRLYSSEGKREEFTARFKGKGISFCKLSYKVDLRGFFPDLGKRGQC